MKELIEKKLKLHGIENLDLITEDGRFYKEFNLKDKKGYNGAININNGSSELIYTTVGMDEENKMYNALILNNFDGENIRIDLSLYDGRDYLKIYEEYKIDKKAFKKNEYLTDTYIKIFGYSEEIFEGKMNDLRNTLLDEIEEQERKLKKTKVRILKKVKNSLKK